MRAVSLMAPRPVPSFPYLPCPAQPGRQLLCRAFPPHWHSWTATVHEAGKVFTLKYLFLRLMWPIYSTVTIVIGTMMYGERWYRKVYLTTVCCWNGVLLFLPASVFPPISLTWRGHLLDLLAVSWFQKPDSYKVSPEKWVMCPSVSYVPETGSLWDQTNHCPKEGCGGNTKWERGGNEACSRSLLLGSLSYATKLSSLGEIQPTSQPVSASCLMQSNRQFQDMLRLIPKYRSNTGQRIHAQTMPFEQRWLPRAVPLCTDTAQSQVRQVPPVPLQSVMKTTK